MSLASQPLPSMSPVQLDENPTNLNNLLFVSQTVLQQAVDLLDSDLLEDEQLTVHSKYLPGSTIGVFKAEPYKLLYSVYLIYT